MLFIRKGLVFKSQCEVNVNREVHSKLGVLEMDFLWIHTFAIRSF